MAETRGIEIIARSVVVSDGKILLCKVKTKDNWFFLGGHVEKGETIKSALSREFKEEIGIDVKRAEFIGMNENEFIFNGEKHQEINAVFEVELESHDFGCCEDHLEFSWFKLEEAKKLLILPEGLKNAVFYWLKNRKTFYCYQ